uniref:Pseudouridylate synthase RPUSD2 n=1 Tax=Culicoides sonorensis TaxID=179676 RepID=A0A336LNY1_CULSO
MQHHPGSWYIPWNMGVPLQKMLTVPFNPNGQMPAGPAYHQPQIGAAAVQHQQPPQSQQQPQTSPNPQQTYQQQLSALQHQAALQHQQMHPAAAAAMFTPLTLRSFVTHSHHGLLSTQQQLTQGAQLGPGNNTTTGMNNHNSPSQQQHQQQQQQHGVVGNQQNIPQTLSPNMASHHHAMLQHHPHAQHHPVHHAHAQQQLTTMNINGVNVTGLPSATAAALRQHAQHNNVLQNTGSLMSMPSIKKILLNEKLEKPRNALTEKRKAVEESEPIKDLKKAKLETKALKAKRPGFTDERYHETSYYIENGLRKVYPYYFTFTTFTKGRWVGEKILDVFAREFRAHPAEEYERCIKAGTLTVNYEQVPTDYRLKHNDLLANVVHRHEVPVTSQPITIVHMDDDIVVVNKPASIPVHPCGRYRHNTVVFILAKEYNLKNLRTIHRLDRLTSGLLLFGRSPKKARQMEHQIRNRQVQKEYICRVEGEFPDGVIECKEPIEVVSYKIGVCKVSSKGKECTTTFQKLGYNGKTSVVLCKPLTGRMHQIRVHLQYLGYPVVNDPLYNHEVFGPNKGRGGDIGGKSDDQLVKDLINIHNAENWLGIDGDSELSMFKSIKSDIEDSMSTKGTILSDDETSSVSREASPCAESPQPARVGSESPNENASLCNGSTNTNITNNEINSPTSPNREVNGITNMSNGTCVSVATSTNTMTSNNTSNTPSNFTCMKNSISYINKGKSRKVTVATQTGQESPDMAFNPDKMTTDKHCYECKVRYRDPKPQDLVMYLHAWKYKGPGWEYETELPEWAQVEWQDLDYD